MVPELKIWLHRQRTRRDWKKIAKRGEIVPEIAFERHPGLKRWRRNHRGVYLMNMDGWRLDVDFNG